LAILFYTQVAPLLLVNLSNFKMAGESISFETPNLAEKQKKEGGFFKGKRSCCIDRYG